MKDLRTPPYTSWTHRLARLCVRPLVGGPITPNHLTAGRLVSGVAACAAFMAGDPAWNLWGGVLWLLSCFLDRADGELARLGGTSSPGGHLFDYYCDVGVNSLFFFAVGVGLRSGALGDGAIALGALAGVSVGLASVFSEKLEDMTATGDKAYAGILGFDFDDVLYLLGPAAWVGLFPYLLVGAAVCAPFFAVLTWVRLRRQATA
ncbi:MAG: CDP-alcohol phosphatidyltransferase family protein [Proteobacteria bacterium]|nr:CDP-alcohol phosphatidyltransferase family protein [Pseudomonadota bacterium]